eukprot:5558235-Lingulodinium_polyedra.AAC.1
MHDLLLQGSSGGPSWRPDDGCQWPARRPNRASCTRATPTRGQSPPSDHECRLRLHHTASTNIA